MAKTVLAIDDSSSMRQLVGFALKDAGYEVISAIHGKDALEKADGKKVDVVVTDLNMPEMDGIEFIKQFKSKAGCRFAPVIMLTTESQAAKQQAGKAAGAAGWLVKPFKPEELLDLIKRFVR